MGHKADIIASLIETAAPRIAVIFSGDQPRLLGTLQAAPSAEAVKAEVDSMLFCQRLSATQISRAMCRERLFVLAHC